MTILLKLRGFKWDDTFCGADHLIFLGSHLAPGLEPILVVALFQGPAKPGSFLILILACGNSPKGLLFPGPGRSRVFTLGYSLGVTGSLAHGRFTPNKKAASPGAKVTGVASRGWRALAVSQLSTNRRSFHLPGAPHPTPRETKQKRRKTKEEPQRREKKSCSQRRKGAEARIRSPSRNGHRFLCLGPPVERLESGYLFFPVVYVSRGTLPPNKETVKPGTWLRDLDICFLSSHWRLPVAAAFSSAPRAYPSTGRSGSGSLACTM